MIVVVFTMAISAEVLRPRPRTVHVTYAASIDPAATTTAIADSDVYGMTQADVDLTMDTLHAIGVKSVRLLIPWAGVEAQKGQLDWSSVDKTVNSAAARGLAVVGTVNSTPLWAVGVGGQYLSGRPASPDAYGEFVAKVAARYTGKISAIEIWNEPNAVTFYTPAPDPAGYTKLLKAAYPRVKAVDPAIVVLGGSMAALIDFGGLTINPVSFLKQMYAAGAQGYFDALAFHPYQYTLKFSDGMAVANSPMIQLMDLRRVMVTNGDGNKKIWSTEYGQPAAKSGEAGENAYVTDMLTKWQELPYAGPTYVYTTRDRKTPSTSNNDTFGIYRKDWTPKPVQQVVQASANGQLSKSPEYQRFATLTDPALGTVLSPVFKATPQNWSQIRTAWTIYETPEGFYTSPNPVADQARCWRVVPMGAFANGYQDFNRPNRLRIWYSQATGAHAARGIIADAWTPDLGLAVTDEQNGITGTRVDFEHGSITWTAGGTTVSHGEHAPRGENAASTCLTTPNQDSGGGYPGPLPGLTPPLASLLALISSVLGLPGRLLGLL